MLVDLLQTSPKLQSFLTVVCRALSIINKTQHKEPIVNSNRPRTITTSSSYSSTNSSNSNSNLYFSSSRSDSSNSSISSKPLRLSDLASAKPVTWWSIPHRKPHNRLSRSNSKTARCLQGRLVHQEPVLRRALRNLRHRRNNRLRILSRLSLITITITTLAIFSSPANITCQRQQPPPQLPQSTTRNLKRQGRALRPRMKI